MSGASKTGAGADPFASRYREVFFDFSGTLVHPLGDRFPVYREVFDRLGLTLARPELERAERAVAEAAGEFTSVYLAQPSGFWIQYEARVVEELEPSAPTAEVVQALRDALVSSRHHPPFPETERVLATLASRAVRLHIVSNYTELLPELLGHLGWAERFATVTYSQEAGAEKPSRAIFELALRRAGCRPGLATIVGDSWEADVEGGRAAGLQAIWVDRDGEAPDHPGPRVRDLSGILPLLLSPADSPSR
ncbi:MAG: HAD family hydrolase [Thermoplasmata archaeon]|nr:HAD family hydrolase [Thermoplasmata archaeon]